MIPIIKAIRKFRIPKSLQWLLIVCNALVLFINLFVGLLVYRDPLLAIKDGGHLFYCLAFGTILGMGLYLFRSLVFFLEKLSSNR